MKLIWYPINRFNPTTDIYICFVVLIDFCILDFLSLLEYNRKWITKFRTSNLPLPIETGRWNNIPREDEKCNFCGNGIGNEFHILFLCENEIVLILRNKYIPNYYWMHPSYVKLVGLLSICNSQLYIKKKKKVSMFIRKIAALLRICILFLKYICHNFYEACLH